MASAPRGLVYVTDAQPGIRRERRPGPSGSYTFIYFSSSGRRITSRTVIARINALAIPPAYTDVWICRNPRGHIQATGRDARGRKQYRYHPRWREVRDRDKHSRMLQFGTALGRLRRALRADLRREGLPRERVLALVVSLLDSTQVRVGNAEYARTNRSYGLSTLQDRHARFFRGGRAVLQFRGKGGMRHEVEIGHPRLARLVRRCQQLPGQQLFQYVDADGRRHGVDSGQVNAYLRDHMGGDFTAKDFRTWHATFEAARLLCRVKAPEKTEAAMSGCINDVVKQVAEKLRHTPAVCRNSYINPRVFDAWKHERLRTPTARAMLRLLRGSS